jgi:hypothetical protein
LNGGNRRVRVPINTFQLQARVVDQMGPAAGRVETADSPRAKPDFKVDRFGEPLP